MLESFEYFCQISSKSIVTILRYAVSKLARFSFETQCSWLQTYRHHQHWRGNMWIWPVKLTYQHRGRTYESRFPNQPVFVQLMQTLQIILTLTHNEKQYY